MACGQIWMISFIYSSPLFKLYLTAPMGSLENKEVELAPSVLSEGSCFVPFPLVELRATGRKMVGWDSLFECVLYTVQESLDVFWQ